MTGSKGAVLGVIGLAVLLFAFATCSPKDGVLTGGLVKREAKMATADRDTAADSLTTITAQTRETRKIVDDEKVQRQQLTQDIKDEYSKLTSTLEKSAKEAKQQAAQTKHELSEEIKRLQRRLIQAEEDQKKANNRPPVTAPVAKLLPVEARKPLKVEGPPADEYQWIEPIDQLRAQKIASTKRTIRNGGLITGSGGAVSKVFGDSGMMLRGNNAASGDGTQGRPLPDPIAALTRDGTSDSAGLIPSYTIPENSTLMGARALTGLFGRVPVSGQIRDALPFRVMTGAENLASQGFEIPDLERAIFSGVAAGDRALRCVEGRLLSVTFIFTDGTIRTVRGSTAQPLGYLFDDHGYPCIPGTYVTDAPRHIAGIAAAGAALGAAGAIADQEVTRYAGREGTTESVTGDTGRYIAGSAAEDAFSEIAGILRDRLKETFDAVVVQPGVTVALGISQEIRIDFDTGGRRIDHAAPHLSQTAGGTASSQQPVNHSDNGQYQWRSPTPPIVKPSEPSSDQVMSEKLVDNGVITQ